MVRSEFPNVRLDRTQGSLGYVAQRNRGALLCSSGITFSIDDDAEFSSPHVVEHTLSGFSHPRVAAIAIPYIEPHRSREEFQKSPHADAIWVTDSFRGTSHALRRDVFLAVGGYREQIVHQGEEMDFCVRLLNNGYVVRLGLGDVIIHRELPRRDWRLWILRAPKRYYVRLAKCSDALSSRASAGHNIQWFQMRFFCKTPNRHDAGHAGGLFRNCFRLALAPTSFEKHLSLA